MMLVALFEKVGVNCLAEHTDEVSKEPLVHVPGHLVENQPVTQGTVFNIVFNMPVIFILLEVSSDFPPDQAVPEHFMVYVMLIQRSKLKTHLIFQKVIVRIL